MAVVAAVLVSLGIVGSLNAAIITDLPYAPTVQFKQYAGYFNTTSTHHMHYWFVESQNDPTTDPVIVWLTGGPGCSGLSALLTENGPFTVMQGGQKLILNEQSWNKVANVLTIESPIGVGFSYTDDGDVSTSDELSAQDNWAALKAFFTEFPQFQENDFYVAGESYGGIYVPMLATEILKKQDTFKINLKGIAIGNGCVSNKLNTDTILLYAYSHGMIDEKTWQRVNEDCCGGKIDGCEFSQFSGWGYCASFVQEAIQDVWYSGVNPYDIYSDCYTDETERKNKKFPSSRAKIDFLQHTKKRFPGNRLDSTLCLDEERETIYLNKPEVRKALNVPDNVIPWADCSNEVYDKYERTQPEMESFVKNLVDNKIRVLIYNGDTDIVCNFLQGQRFSASLGLQQTSSKYAYHVNGQIGGYHTQYGNVEFVTVRGAGHMVPTDKPEVSLHIIRAFLKQRKP